MSTVDDLHLTVQERAERGRAARGDAPRTSHGDWAPADDRPDPIALLEEQARTRVPDLVPIRNGRMAASPFAFFRGAAYIMAADLAGTPRTGLVVQACGDAHLSNFGGFAAPDRQEVFDLNDFDETLPGPWEWDVKRLAVSLEIAGRDRSLNRKERADVVAATLASYREAMASLAALGNLDVFYMRIDGTRVTELARAKGARKHVDRLERNSRKARKKDRLRALRKLTTEVDGERQFVSDPPLLVPARDLVAERAELEELVDSIGALLVQYRETLRDELRTLLERYRYVDLARKVVGVGSVGTRAWVVLLIGRDGGDPLFMQVKESQASVLERFLEPSAYDNHGRRVVEGQRLTQAAGDVLLGWIRAMGIDGEERDFYVRQLWDWKRSAEIENMDADALRFYGVLCGWALARAHARSGDSVAIAAYLGSSDRFDRAIVQFASAYAEQNDRDHEAFVQAIADGRLEAAAGI
jgi:uncharacterized protein (DUF2252 family)